MENKKILVFKRKAKPKKRKNIEMVSIPEIDLPFMERVGECLVEKGKLVSFIRKISRGGAYKLPRCLGSDVVLSLFLDHNPTVSLEVRDHFQTEESFLAAVA